MITSLKRSLYVFLAVFTDTLLSLLSGGNERAWCRNSLRLGYFSRRSDLDLTFFVHGPMSGTATAISNLLERTGLGETAVYEAADRDWAFLANPFELARDPLLGGKMERASSPSKADAIVYLLRMFSSDKFLKDPKLVAERQKKWSFHLRELEGILKTKISSKSERLPSETAAQLMDEALSVARVEKWRESEISREQKHFLYPHLWLHEARYHSWPIEPQLSDSALLEEIRQGQVRWEMWGLLGQARKNQMPDSLEEHLSLLWKLLPEATRRELRTEEFLKYLKARFSRAVSS